MSEYRDQRHFEAYLAELRRFCTAEELGALLRLLGDPKQATDFHAALSKIIKREERIEWLLQTAKTAAGWFVAIGAAVIMWRDVLPIILTAIGGGE